MPGRARQSSGQLKYRIRCKFAPLSTIALAITRDNDIAVQQRNAHSALDVPGRWHDAASIKTALVVSCNSSFETRLKVLFAKALQVE